MSGAGKKRVSEVDALLMPFLRQIEKSNQALQDAKHLGLDTEAMKQLLDKVTQDRMQILKDAQTQLSPGAHKRLKRLLGPLAKDVEKVRFRARIRVRVLALAVIVSNTRCTSHIIIIYTSIVTTLSSTEFLFPPSKSTRLN